VRFVAAVAAAAFTALVASLIVGEYGVAGWVTIFVGVVAGLVIGEVASSVAGSREWSLALTAAAIAAAGVAWGAWLDSGRGVAPLGSEAFAAPALAAVVAAFTVRTYRKPRPAAEDPAPASEDPAPASEDPAPTGE
jgi:hypothetical protein